MQPFRVCFDLGMSFVDVEASVRMETRKSFKYFCSARKYVRTILNMVVGRAELCENNISRISEIS